MSCCYNLYNLFIQKIKNAINIITQIGKQLVLIYYYYKFDWSMSK